ncbi:MAG: ribonuclease P protein component [bacterium]
MESLKKNEDFKRCYSTGKSYANRYLVLYVCGNGLGRNRIGISVSKKVGNSIVRHRVTRLIRESYRLHEQMFNSGLDMAVVARSAAKDADYHSIEKALLHLSGKAKIYDQKSHDKND